MHTGRTKAGAAFVKVLAFGGPGERDAGGRRKSDPLEQYGGPEAVVLLCAGTRVIVYPTTIAAAVRLARRVSQEKKAGQLSLACLVTPCGE